MKKGSYIIIRGPLGVGKSTISEAVSKVIGAEKVSIDRIVDDSSLVKKEKEEGYISQKSFKEANEIAVSRVKDKLDSGISVVFDGNFYWESVIKDLEERLNDYKGFVFTLKAPLDVCIKRDSEREKTHGEIAAKVVHKKSTSFTYGIEIDAENKTKDEIVEVILMRIEK